MAQGTIEAGVRVAGGYPGAPISDFQGSFDPFAGNIPRNNPFTVLVGKALDEAACQLVSRRETTSNKDNVMALALGAVIGKGDYKKTRVSHRRSMGR